MRLHKQHASYWANFFYARLNCPNSINFSGFLTEACLPCRKPIALSMKLAVRYSFWKYEASFLPQNTHWEFIQSPYVPDKFPRHGTIVKNHNLEHLNIPASGATFIAQFVILHLRIVLHKLWALPSHCLIISRVRIHPYTRIYIEKGPLLFSESWSRMILPY